MNHLLEIRFIQMESRSPATEGFGMFQRFTSAQQLLCIGLDDSRHRIFKGLYPSYIGSMENHDFKSIQGAEPRGKFHPSRDQQLKIPPQDGPKILGQLNRQPRAL